MSNAMSFILLFTVVLSTFGRSSGWLLLAVASLIGNLRYRTNSDPSEAGSPI